MVDWSDSSSDFLVCLEVFTKISVFGPACTEMSGGREAK